MARGLLTSMVDGKSQTIIYLYDAMHRRTMKSFSTSEAAVTYTYDDPAVSNSKGRLTNVAKAGVTSRVGGFDALGRPLTAIKTIPGLASSQTTTYAYDCTRIRSLTYPDGFEAVRNRIGVPIP